MNKYPPTAIAIPVIGKVEIRLFGKPDDWSTNALQMNEEAANGRFEPKNEGLRVYWRIHEVCHDSNVEEIFAPNPWACNSSIANEHDFKKSIQMPQSTIPPDHNFLTIIRNDVEADGAVISPNKGFWIGSADCPTIAVCGKGKYIIAAHGARDSLCDRVLLESGKVSKKFPSVVDAILVEFKKLGERLKDIRIHIACGVYPDNFLHSLDDPKHGSFNRKLIEYFLSGKNCQNVLIGPLKEGRIDLVSVIKNQFANHGVESHRISSDGYNTYGDRQKDSFYLWHSFSRDETKARNGVLVINRSGID